MEKPKPTKASTGGHRCWYGLDGDEFVYCIVGACIFCFAIILIFS